MEPVTITSSRRKLVLLLAAALLFVATATLLPTHRNDVWRLFAGSFFGLAAVVFVALLIRPHRLTLDSHGVTVSGGLVPREWSIAWADVDHFEPMGGTDMVGFTYRNGAGGASPLRKVNRKISNVDGAIPGSWPMSAAQMAALLEDYRTRAVTNGAPAPAIGPGRGRGA
jgi:hypothetical protein